MDRIQFAALFGGLFVIGATFADDPQTKTTEHAEAMANAPASVPAAPALEPIADQISTEPESEAAVQLVQDAQVEPLPPAPQPIQPDVSDPEQSARLAASIFGAGGVERSLLSESRRALVRAPATDVILGGEAEFRNTTDVGSLLGRSTSTLNVTAQRRTPIVTDPRVRGNGLGRLNASGSYWVPARADLDTILSKIDSRDIQDIIVIKGPYSVRYGPGAAFIDFELLSTPRYECGFEAYGSSSVEYQTNGENWYGRQSFWGGDADWGFRVTYGHRTANDYETGGGFELPSSFKSRDLDVAIGGDLTENSHLEFRYLRLDQTDVEFPGQFFDINFLVTDAFEVTLVVEDQPLFDLLTAEAWYNDTRFQGDASRTGKRKQIPSIDINMINRAFTDVDSQSTGFTVASTWGEDFDPQLTVGADMRYVKQHLDEFLDISIVTPPALSPPLPPTLDFVDVNSPIPKAHSSNPGVFSEVVVPVGDRLVLTGGARADWVSTNVEDTPSGLDSGVPQMPLTLQGILQNIGGEEFARDFQLWALYGTAEWELNECWTMTGAAGVGMRPPTITELYAAGPFLALLQNGRNGFLGNPNLDASRHTQIDLGIAADYGRFRGGMNGFHAWIEDYITYEVVFLNTLAAEPDSRGVSWVNTPHATLAGAEVYSEYDVSSWLTTFATMSYVEGRDKSRNEGGQRSLNPAIPAMNFDPNAPRGVLPGGEREPLPGIPPLESRIGIRLHDPCPCGAPLWVVEFSARIVDAQERVATSLLEQPTAGFTTYDIRSIWQVSDQVSLIAGVENISDKFYREHLDLRTGRGVFQPGRNFYFGSELVY